MEALCHPAIFFGVHVWRFYDTTMDPTSAAMQQQPICLTRERKSLVYRRDKDERCQPNSNQNKCEELKSGGKALLLCLAQRGRENGSLGCESTLTTTELRMIEPYGNQEHDSGCQTRPIARSRRAGSARQKPRRLPNNDSKRLLRCRTSIEHLLK